MTHDLTDTTTGLVRTVRNAHTRIADRLNATDVDVDVHRQDGDPERATVRLQFDGFSSLAGALERQADVAQHLAGEPGVDDIHAGVNTDGGRDYDGPTAWVNAELTIPVDPIDAVDGESEECCPDPEDACENCAGDRSKPDALYHPLDSTKMESPSETGDE